MKRALLVLALVGCGPQLIWSGRTADRLHRVEVIRRGGLDYVTVDGVRRGAFAGIAGWSLALATDHVAFAARVGTRWVVVLDGRAGETWDAIGQLQFSRTGRLAYVAERDHKWHVVADDRAGPGFESILAGTLRWSDDGAHHAYVGSNAGRVQAVVDGVAGPVFDGISSLALDGRRHAYAARRVFEAFIVVDGVASQPWTSVRGLVIANNRVAYAASDGKDWRVVVDGEAGPAMSRFYRLALTAAHVAWVGRIDDQDVIALDGKPVAARDRLRPEGLVLSDRGLAYIDTENRAERVVVDGQPGPAFDEVGAPVWSVDGRVAYSARRGTSHLVVVDGRELDAGQAVGAPVFSADGKRFAYAVRRSKRWFVHADGTEHEFDLVLPDSVVFSRDGKRWAAIAGDLRREQLFIVVEGNRRVPLPTTEIYSAAAWNDHDATATLLSWVRAEVDR